ncbi:hypothetical protein VDBG_01460 [Verticillium alfalfae VaMs.102]|uniref:MARVEL domain-containing protein n=1 Tax=Verticillium alfalfae (strain VaMs.102 / ATCC MYA-4576 / FGSC 10136) TaxID=526221 RepID=C9S8G1_VERA1|nr:hypothetical protein VDBG_01460 [Verticillium alfalfae VaMs.102]EEY15351.1 hypothetical protein VDBG_01460 [Verticillium alfalfae VaMs.102]
MQSKAAESSAAAHLSSERSTTPAPNAQPTVARRTQPPLINNVQSFVQQPYLYPPQPPLYGPGPREPRIIPFTRSWHIAKIVLRSVELACAIIVIALTIALISVALYAGHLPLALSLPPACMCVLWETAEFITLCARGGKQGIHPGAHVGVHLVTWLYWALGIVCMGMFSFYRGQYRDSSDFDYGMGLNYGIIGTSAAAFLVTFTLFVRACVETNQRNRQQRQIFVMTGNGGPFYVMPQAQASLMQQYPQAMPMPRVHDGAPQYPPARDHKAPVTGGAPAHPVMSPADGSFYGPGNPHQQQS